MNDHPPIHIRPTHMLVKKPSKAITITGVALLMPSGMLSLPAPHRHHHLFALAAFLGIDPEPSHQGFTTSKGVFVHRDSAAIIAHVAEQLKPGANPGLTELYSEDVW